ncbi:MAG: hypothetical protein L0Y72_14350 [Gemmataceae bacterium]|nr:hypothetical protein [Gemmataceae bacterium]MCI0740224.1 hypothetical protein [Gemmataceae bacterium]
MRSGVGLSWLLDRFDTDFGFNFHYGADVFPVHPLVLSGSADLGFVGNAGVAHVRGSAGVLWRNWEFFGGYDFLRIGRVELHGPMIGIRLWF